MALIEVTEKAGARGKIWPDVSASDHRASEIARQKPMTNEHTSSQKDEESEEEQIHTVTLDWDELHHLKMIALRYLEDHTSTRQILQETLTGKQEDIKQIYDTIKTAQEHRQNNDTLRKSDSIRLSVKDIDVTALITSLSEYPEEEWSFVQDAWQRSIRRLVDQVGGKRHNV